MSLTTKMKTIGIIILRITGIIIISASILGITVTVITKAKLSYRRNNNTKRQFNVNKCSRTIGILEELSLEERLALVKECFSKLTNDYGKEINEVDKDDKDRLDKISNLPKDFILFMTLTDGMYDIGAGSITNVEDIFSEETIRYNKKYLKSYAGTPVGDRYIDRADEFIFFANDGLGGEYAFSKKIDDEKVYYFDHENVNEVRIYNSFATYLEDWTCWEEEYIRES